MILGTGTPAWEVVGGPFLGAFMAIAAVVTFAYPIYRRREEQAKDRQARLEATCDAVLGKEPDKNKGIHSFKPGLVQLFPLNGNRIDGVPTIMDELSTLKTLVQDHAAQDDERFGALGIAPPPKRRRT